MTRNHSWFESNLQISRRERSQCEGLWLILTNFLVLSSCCGGNTSCKDLKSFSPGREARWTIDSYVWWCGSVYVTPLGGRRCGFLLLPNVFAISREYLPLPRNLIKLSCRRTGDRGDDVGSSRAKTASEGHIVLVCARLICKEKTGQRF